MSSYLFEVEKCPQKTAMACRKNPPMSHITKRLMNHRNLPNWIISKNHNLPGTSLVQSRRAAWQTHRVLPMCFVSSILIWLVVWNIFYFPIYFLDNRHPNWLSYFSEGLVHHQPVIGFRFVGQTSWFLRGNHHLMTYISCLDMTPHSW